MENSKFCPLNNCECSSIDNCAWRSKRGNCAMFEIRGFLESMAVANLKEEKQRKDAMECLTKISEVAKNIQNLGKR